MANTRSRRRREVAGALLLPLLLLLLLPTSTRAFVPPKPGSDLEKTYEPVHAYRKRLGITYNYTPKLLHAEMCRHLTEDECQKADEAMQEHATSHQTIQRRLNGGMDNDRRRNLIAVPDDVTNLTRTKRKVNSQEEQEEFHEMLGAFTKAYGRGPHNMPTKEEELAELEQLLIEFNTTREEHYRQRARMLQSNRDTATFNPSTGTFVVPLLLLRFTDHESRELPPMYEYQILWNLRIKKWIDENSYGKYSAWFDVQDWQTTDNTEEHYSFGEAGRVRRFQAAFAPLLDTMDENLGGDWSLYDVDGDGSIDNMIVIHSGYAAEEGGADCTNGRTTENRIWSHAFAESAGDGWTSSNGQYSVRGYMIAAGLDLVCDSNPAKMGVMTHEYLHTFFIIDLYDGQFDGKGIGNFDIMAYPYGHANTGYIPVNLSPWAKQTIEWQECEQITSSGEYTLEPAATSDNCYWILLMDFNPNAFEYILLENRQQTDFDIAFWRPGLVMYHIDDAQDDQRWRGYPGSDPEWPASGDHYRVAVIQADGNYDLEKGNNIGDEGDIWVAGMKLTPNIDGQTFPNTDSYQDGYIEATGITIEVLEQDGMNVRVKVDFGTRSGDSSGDQAFSTPTRERDEPAHQQLADMAEHQFTVPDDSEHGISGMIPQLGWYDEYQEQKMRNATKIFEAEPAVRSAGYQCGGHGNLLALSLLVVSSIAYLSFYS